MHGVSFDASLHDTPGITTNLLAKRLKELAARGIVEHQQTQDAQLWALTELGRTLEPVVLELGRFGARTMDRPRRGERTDLVSAVFSLKRRYVTGTLDGALVAIETPRRTFELAGLGASLAVAERPSPHARVRIQGAEDAVRAWLFGAPSDGVRIEGMDAQAFLRAFGIKG